jgi:hypothetical protein
MKDMTREEIEQAIQDAGWRIDDGFPEYLVIGSDGDRSMLAHREAWGTDHPTFELWDEREDVSYWVREIPTPRQAEELLQEHGAPPKEELSILYQ